MISSLTLSVLMSSVVMTMHVNTCTLVQALVETHWNKELEQVLLLVSIIFVYTLTSGMYNEMVNIKVFRLGI